MDPFAGLSDDERALLRPAPLPERVEPMKAVLTDEPFSDPGLDLRAQARRDPVRRDQGRDPRPAGLAQRPEPRRALPGGRRPRSTATRPASFVVDGEVVAFEGSQTSFARLQQRGERPVAVFLYVFDLLHLAGHDTTALPLRARKRLLRARARVRRPGPPDPAPQPRRRGAVPRGVPQGLGGPDRQARRLPLHARPLARLAEVQVLGRAGARDRRLHRAAGEPHRAGRAAARLLRRRASCATRARSGPASRRRRCATSPRGSRRCAGTARRSPTRSRERDATWVEPRLVAQVGFTEWTRDGRLRHPRFLGLREDKAAEEVVRE